MSVISQLAEVSICAGKRIRDLCLDLTIDNPEDNVFWIVYDLTIPQSMIVDDSNEFVKQSSETDLGKQIVRMLRAKLRCNDIEPVVSKLRLPQRHRIQHRSPSPLFFA
jgi:hypothetical protein